MKFETKCIYTGTEVIQSKNGNKYILLNFLDDNGKTFSVISNLDIPEGINQLDIVNVEFELLFANRKIYMRVNKVWKE